MKDFILVSAKIIPQSKKNSIEDVFLEDDYKVSLKVRTTAPPTDGKANQAIINDLAKYFSVKKSEVEIIRGHTSRQKIIKVYNATIKSAQTKMNFA